MKRLQRGLFCRICAISRLILAHVCSNCEASWQCLAKCASPTAFGIFRPPDGFAEPPSFRLSRDVCDGTSNRKLATVAVNLLGPRRGARAPSAACLLEARLEVDVALPSTPPRAGRARAAPPRALAGLRRLVTVLGLVKVATRPGSLRASLAGARRTPSRLGAPAGSVGRSEAGGVGGCPIRRLGAL